MNEVKIKTPYGVKNWNFVKKCLDSDVHLNRLIEAVHEHLGCLADAEEDINPETKTMFDDVSELKDAVEELDKIRTLNYLTLRGQTRSDSEPTDDAYVAATSCVISINQGRKPKGGK